MRGNMSSLFYLDVYDQHAFVFATRGHCIKDKQCQHLTIKNKISVCIQNNLSYFPFMHCPLVGKQKWRWSIGGAISHRKQKKVLQFWPKQGAKFFRSLFLKTLSRFGRRGVVSTESADLWRHRQVDRDQQDLSWGPNASLAGAEQA